jgi:hypothetical protein
VSQILQEDVLVRLQLAVVPEAVAHALAEQVRRRLGVAADAVWWWQACAPLENIGASNMGLHAALATLPGSEGSLFMFVSDDEPPPWPCVTGSAMALSALIAESPYFEYLIAPPDAAWVLFDTHDNQLLLWREPRGG